MAAAGGSCQSSVGEIPEGGVAIQALTSSAAGWLIFVAIVIIIYEAVFITQRFLNISVINNNITIVIIIVSPWGGAVFAVGSVDACEHSVANVCM